MKKYEFDAVILKRDGQDAVFIEFSYMRKPGLHDNRVI